MGQEREAIALAVLTEIRNHQSEIFPTSIRSTKAVSRWRERAMRLPVVGGWFTVRQMLFGGLVEEVERQLDRYGVEIISAIQQNSVHLLQQQLKDKDEGWSHRRASRNRSASRGSRVRLRCAPKGGGGLMLGE